MDIVDFNYFWNVHFVVWWAVSERLHKVRFEYHGK